MTENPLAIGIDLGTSTCSVAVMRDGQVQAIPDRYGSLSVPTVVAFTRSARLTGKDASEQLSVDPLNTVFSVKRLMGRTMDKTVETMTKEWPFRVTEVQGKPNISVFYKDKYTRFSPEEVTAMVLRHLKANSERFLGQDVNSAVITVPASFTETQRRATLDAATLAGLRVLRLVNESSATAVSYGTLNKSSYEVNMLVLNLGAGFLDVTVLKINDDQFQVQSVVGDANLGGDDFDYLLVRYFARAIFEQYGRILTLRAQVRLKKACEKAKRKLSSSSKTVLRIDSLLRDFDFLEELTREQFEEMCSSLLQRLSMSVEKALEIAGIEPEAIHQVILVGGSTRIPKIQSILEHIFKDKELQLTGDVDQTKVYGAAVIAAFMNGEESVSEKVLSLEERSAYSISLESTEGISNVLFERNTTIPCTTVMKHSISYDDSTSLSYRIFEGGFEEPSEKSLLNTLVLTWTPASPRNVPAELEIAFNIDYNGCLNVSSKLECAGDIKEVQVSKISSRDRINGGEVDLMQMQMDIEEREERMRKALLHLEYYVASVQSGVIKACGNALRLTRDNPAIDESDVDRILKNLKLNCNYVIFEELTFGENSSANVGV